MSLMTVTGSLALEVTDFFADDPNEEATVASYTLFFSPTSEHTVFRTV